MDTSLPLESEWVTSLGLCYSGYKMQTTYI